MTEPAYSVRASLLKCFARSAGHARAYIDGGLNDETLSMRLGTGGHALTFGTPEVVVYRGGTKLTDKVVKGKKGEPDTTVQVAKDYSAVRSGSFWEAFELEHAGKVILNETEYAKASAMAEAIQTHPDAYRLLFAPGTRHEFLAEWLMGGRRCSGRFDSLGPVALSDLKCVQDASPHRLRYQARTLGWAAQLAWYLDGCELAGLGPRDGYLVAVENAPPWSVQVYAMTDDDLDFGREQYNGWLDQLLACEASGYWPGYADGILPLNVRQWPRPMIEDETDDDEQETADT